MRKLFLYIATCIVFQNSCNVFDSGGETIRGKYNIFWIDQNFNRKICYAGNNWETGGHIKIEPFVSEIKYNYRYIIVKRVFYEFEKDEPNYDSIAYFIIDMKKETSLNNEDVSGPFTKSELEIKKQKIKFDGMIYTKKYD